jgi:hypothetical protein
MSSGVRSGRRRRPSSPHAAGATRRVGSTPTGSTRASYGRALEAVRFRRLVVALGVPSVVLAALQLDPCATPASAGAIVRHVVGLRAWRQAMRARTLPARASIMLAAILERQRNDAMEAA